MDISVPVLYNPAVKSDKKKNENKMEYIDLLRIQQR